MLWVACNEFFDGHDKRGQRNFHVTGTTAIQLAIAVAGRKRGAAPFGQGPRRHDIGVAGKHQRLGLRTLCYRISSCLRIFYGGCSPFCP